MLRGLIKLLNMSHYFYHKKINGFQISVTKTMLPSGKVAWYNSLYKNNKTVLAGEDFYPTKKQAKDAIIYVANNPKEYGLI